MRVWFEVVQVCEGNPALESGRGGRSSTTRIELPHLRSVEDLVDERSLCGKVEVGRFVHDARILASKLRRKT